MARSRRWSSSSASSRSCGKPRSPGNGYRLKAKPRWTPTWVWAKRCSRSFTRRSSPRKVEAIEYPFAVPLSDPNTGENLDMSLVGVVDLIESDDEGNLIIAELKTSSKRYADSQGENQLDGLIYAYAIDKLGFRTTGVETLIRYDVLVKTKSPAFQQIYFNKTPQDYGRLARWIQEVLQAIDRESFFPNFGWACQNCQFRSRCWKM